MSDTIYDLAVVGSGPAGLSAALVAKLRNKSVLLLSAGHASRKLEQAPVIENYLGVPGAVGSDLRAAFLKHVADAGVETVDVRITAIYPGEGSFSLFTNDTEYAAKSVVLAMGMSRAATLPGEAEFLGRGVSYCATCDGPLFKGKTVAVVAGVPEAEHEAAYLAEICAKVLYVPQYKAVGTLPANVEIVTDRPTAIEGDSQVRKLALAKTTLEVDAVFVVYDAMPTEQMLAGLEMDEGHVRVDRSMRTNIGGIFAAGDCAGKPYQIAKAVGEGQMAALSAVAFLAEGSKP